MSYFCTLKGLAPAPNSFPTDVEIAVAAPSNARQYILPTGAFGVQAALGNVWTSEVPGLLDATGTAFYAFPADATVAVTVTGNFSTIVDAFAIPPGDCPTAIPTGGVPGVVTAGSSIRYDAVPAPGAYTLCVVTDGTSVIQQNEDPAQMTGVVSNDIGTISGTLGRQMYRGSLGGQYAFAGINDVLAPVVGDLVPTVPGVEHALPLLIERDLDGDGIEDRLLVRYRVRQAVTGDLLHETTQKAFNTPIPCTSPIWRDDDGSGSWLRAEGSTRVHFLQAHTWECVDYAYSEAQRADKAMIYSADTSSAAGVVWTYQVNRETMAFDLVDFDGDGDQDVMLTTATIVEGTETWYVRAMDAESGALISERSYTVVRP